MSWKQIQKDTNALGGKSLKTLQITRRFVRDDWGGTETVVLETSKRMLSRGIKTEVLCPNALAESNRERMEGLEIKRFPYFYPYLGLTLGSKHQLDKKAGNLFSFSLMRHLKREPSLDLLHLHTGKRLGGIVRHVARSRNIPYVVSLHGGLLDVPQEESDRWTEPTKGSLEWGKALGWWVGSRRVLKDAAAIICVGASEYEAVKIRFPEKKVVRLPNGVDVKRFQKGDGARFRDRQGISPDDYLMLCVGRIDPQKNQLELIRSMPSLLQMNSKSHLLLVGHVTSSEYESLLINEIANLGLSKKVTMIRGMDSQSADLVDAYHSANLFVLPSFHEPFGIVVVEAWAAGLPVLASRVGGLADLISDHHDGRFFDPNTPHDCSVKISEMMNLSPDTINTMTTNAFKKVSRKYSWDCVSEQLINLYREAANDQRSN
ncbi:MAG: glycosyltransferase family 4 protein [Mariniblastus sp.]|nr:glycosyltransferase family 4 protein [Mariniblastus sp.]